MAGSSGVCTALARAACIAHTARACSVCRDQASPHTQRSRLCPTHHVGGGACAKCGCPAVHASGREPSLPNDADKKQDGPVRRGLPALSVLTTARLLCRWLLRHEKTLSLAARVELGHCKSPCMPVFPVIPCTVSTVSAPAFAPRKPQEPAPAGFYHTRGPFPCSRRWVLAASKLQEPAAGRVVC